MACICSTTRLRYLYIGVLAILRAVVYVGKHNLDALLVAFVKGDKLQQTVVLELASMRPLNTLVGRARRGEMEAEMSRGDVTRDRQRLRSIDGDHKRFG
jgi:hypothetical protein